MPNWVKNIVEFSGSRERVRELLEFIRGDESPIDFQKIIPMPEELNIEAGSRTDDGYKNYKQYKSGGITGELQKKREQYAREHPDCWKLGKRAYENEEKYGFKDWYDWCIAKWGTKWNACDASDAGNNTISFETAWDCPYGIFEELSKLFPDVSFEVCYADEDIGSNCGIITYRDKELSFEQDSRWEKNYCIEFACEVWGSTPEEYGYVLNKDGEYEYEEDF